MSPDEVEWEDLKELLVWSRAAVCGFFDTVLYLFHLVNAHVASTCWLWITTKMRSKPLGEDFCFHLFLINCKLPLSFGLPRSADPGDTGALPALGATVPNCERLKSTSQLLCTQSSGKVWNKFACLEFTFKKDPTDVVEIHASLSLILSLNYNINNYKLLVFKHCY